MSMFRRRERVVPGLNTAALPDLIFTVLFFFMIVTHMRQNDVHVQYQVPKGTQVEKLASKSAVQYVYIGKAGDTYQIQLNNDIVTLDELRQRIMQTVQQLDDADRERLIVSIRADRDTPMGMVGDVKQALREASALRVHYAADEEVQETSAKCLSTNGAQEGAR